MKRILFLTSHIGSDFDLLSEALNEHPYIEMFKEPINKIEDIEAITSKPHKCRNILGVYGTAILQNHLFSYKPLYKICDFVYFIRSAKDTLNEIVKAGVDEKTAFNYYTFRLRRIAEMAYHTPNSILLTWDNISDRKGLDLIQNLFSFKIPFNYPKMREKPKEIVSLKIYEKAQERYEKFLYYIRQKIKSIG